MSQMPYASMDLRPPDGPSSPLHAQLVDAAARWLRTYCRSSVIITDMAHQGAETPDAIGWGSLFRSVLVECKASRADFFADSAKAFRFHHPEKGMGRYRVYCTPRGLVKPAEVPRGWGLLEFDGRRFFRLVDPLPQPDICHRQEVSLLLSAIRRIATMPIPGMSVKFYTMDASRKASIGVDPDTDFEI